jgi:nucleotide-binding universal stress UspA family protein
MLVVHTVLHPTDFSGPSSAALGLACALARDYGARLVVLHVVAAPVVIYAEGVAPPDMEDLRAAGQEELDRLAVPDDGIRVERRLAEGEATEEILRAAGDTNADLIVMGTHVRTGLGRLLMGSVAEQVVRRAPCPVLTVKTPRPAPVSSGTTAEGAREAAAVR